jgi:hypothetical protein
MQERGVLMQERQDDLSVRMVYWSQGERNHLHQ